MAYTEHKTDQQSNINIAETFRMAVKAPAIADRIFDTYEEADAYVKDVNSSATPGLILSIINDDTSLNGLYQVLPSDTEHDSYGMPVLYLNKQGAVQSDWLETNTQSLAYIKHRPTTDYGTFTINSDGTVTGPPYAAGYMDYDSSLNP